MESTIPGSVMGTPMSTASMGMTSMGGPNGSQMLNSSQMSQMGNSSQMSQMPMRSVPGQISNEGGQMQMSNPGGQLLNTAGPMSNIAGQMSNVGGQMINIRGQMPTGMMRPGQMQMVRPIATGMKLSKVSLINQDILSSVNLVSPDKSATLRSRV